jgi:hypothetical protein
MNLRVRAAELMAQPKGSMPHDDHFHVRIGCPNGMEGCIEQPTPNHHKKNQHSAIASSHAPPPAHASAAKPSHPPPPAKPKEKDQEEASVPNLAPMVPGLDSAVIPKPLATPTPDVKKPDPIDDPDGVLESH